MLTTNLPLLKQNLNQLIETPPVKESVMYKAAYNAFYNVTKVDIDTKCTDPDLLPIILSKKKECEQKMKDDANKFASDFCNALKDGGFMDIIADEINNHIKSAQIDITIPALPPTIISPMGTCSGSLIISKSTGANFIIS